MHEEFARDVAVIKWTVIFIAAYIWGLTAFFFLKGLPTWWHSFDKEKQPSNLAAPKKRKKPQRKMLLNPKKITRKVIPLKKKKIKLVILI